MNCKSLKLFLVPLKWAAAGLVALALSGAAGAAVTLVMGDTSGNNGTDVEGTMVYEVTEVKDSDDEYQFSFSLENTSTLGGTRLTGVAFDLLDGSTVSAYASPTGWTFDVSFNGEPRTLPGEAGAFDTCWYAGSNCGSGGNAGLDESDPALEGFSVTFQLAGFSGAAGVEAAFAAGFGDSLRACVRIISIPTSGPGSGNSAGSDVACADGGDGSPPQEIPEPAPIAMIGLTLASLALMRRRATPRRR